MTARTRQADRAEQAHLVTREFHGLQGYKLLPWVPAILLWWGSEAGALRGDWWPWAFGTSLLAAAAGSWLVGRWYTRTYGNVRRSGEQAARLIATVVLVLVVVSVAMGGLALGGYWPADGGDHVIATPALLFGLAWAVAGWRIRGLTPATWWLGLALAAAGLLPLGLLERFGGQHPLNADGAVFGVLAVFAVVAALTSHRALDRALTTSPATPGSEGA